MAMPATRSGRPNNSGTRGGVASTAPFPLAAEQYDKKNEEEFRRQLTELLDPLRNQIAALTTVLMASMIGNDSGVSGANVAEALDALVKRSGDTMTGVLHMVASSRFLKEGGTEGGQFLLEKPASGTTLSGDVVVDIVNDLMRVFDAGGTNKGAYLDLAVQAAGAGSRIVTDAYHATQTEAEDGTSSTNYLTPLRASQGTLVGVRSGLNLSGGGTVTWNGSTYLGWTTRFIVIGDAKGTENPHGGAYTDINQPTSGSIDVVGTTAVTATAAGIPLGAWQALYYDIDAGSAAGASAFHIIRYDAGTTNFVPPPSWVLVAVVNSDSTTVKVLNGMVLPLGGSAVYGQYAPLASPTFTGTPAAPTAGSGTDTTQIATTAFVQQEINAQVAFELLATGTASSQATLDLVLTSYTAYKNIMIVIDSLRGANDDDELICRFSTDGGSNYDAGAGNYSFTSYGLRDNGSASNFSLASATNIQFNTNGAQLGIGNAANEGYDLCITLWHRTSTAHWTRLSYQGVLTSGAATPETISNTGGGTREAAQDTDAIRFSMNSGGNIAACNYSIYGMR